MSVRSGAVAVRLISGSMLLFTRGLGRKRGCVLDLGIGTSMDGHDETELKWLWKTKQIPLARSAMSTFTNDQG